MQVVLQNNVIRRAMRGKRKMHAPRLVGVRAAIPYLRRFPASCVGAGPPPEHIGTPAHLPA
jgi:hypothetical protein